MRDAAVVLVHGLWMNGLELGVLGHRLRHELGCDTYVFSYPTLHGDAARICDELAEFASRVGGRSRPVHFVGHSLGGAIVRRLLAGAPADGGFRAGRAVLLGSPLNGSRAARAVADWQALRPLLGPLVLAELLRPCHGWDGRVPLGSIAGTRPLGTGQFFAHFDEEHDGTVAVSETVIPGLADHLVLAHSHFGMLFAGDVAAQVGHFLRHGRFRRDILAP